MRSIVILVFSEWENIIKEEISGLLFKRKRESWGNRKGKAESKIRIKDIEMFGSDRKKRTKMEGE